MHSVAYALPDIDGTWEKLRRELPEQGGDIFRYGSDSVIPVCRLFCMYSTSKLVLCICEQAFNLVLVLLSFNFV